MAKIASSGSDEFRQFGLLNLPGTDHLRMARFVHNTSLERSVRRREASDNRRRAAQRRALALALAARPDSG